MRKRFTPKQRRAFVREWRRSRLSAKAFAVGRGFHPVTLCKWGRAERSDEERGVRFVEVVPTPAEASQWVWELKGPGGELRGGTLDVEALRVLVRGVVRGVR